MGFVIQATPGGAPGAACARRPRFSGTFINALRIRWIVPGTVFTIDLMNSLPSNTANRWSSRRRTTVLAAAVLSIGATLAPAVMTSIAPQASADSGRRICFYTGGVADTITVPGTGPNTGNVPVLIFTGVNYKKDGACPILKASKMPGGINQAQPAPKVKCEDWTAKIKATGYLWGSYEERPAKTADPCTKMDADSVVSFRVRKSDGVALVAYYGKYQGRQ